MSGFGFKSLKRSCPICDGARRDCRENLNTGLIHCRDANANPGGQWRYIKDDAHGFGMWVWDDGGNGTDNRANRPTYTPKEPSSPSVAAWDVAERDKGYQPIVGNLTLQHRLALRKRGLTDQTIDAFVAAGIVATWPGGQTVAGATLGLPGVRPDGRLVACNTWAVFAHNVDGQIIGGQYRNDRDDTGKYKALSGWGGASYNVDGEQPLTVLGTTKNGLLNFAEGIGFKPAHGWHHYGDVWVGCIGTIWASSPKQLKAIIDRHNITEAVLNPDGGMLGNAQVIGNYRKLALLLQDWGIPLKVRWWGQTEKSHGDVDEISLDTFHKAKLLSWAEFERFSPHREISDVERARIRARERRERERQQWLASVAALAGVPEDSDRATIAGAFHTQHTLSGPYEVGTFPALALPTGRRLTVLDGQKMTRKTSGSLRSAVERALALAKTTVIYVPTRVLAGANETVLKVLLGLPLNDPRILTVDKFLALPEDKRPKHPVIIACPESAWKLSDIEPDVVIFDEPNESIPRVQSGKLGNRPQESREIVISHLERCQWAIVAQDGIYRPTVAAVQRWGGFSPDEVQTIRRQRVPTKIAIQLYLGMAAATESWDGTEAKAPHADHAFFTWFDGIVRRLLAGKKVIIPCGSEGKGRAIHRMLRSLFPEKKGQVLDGKFTPREIRKAFGEELKTFAPTRCLDWLIYSPTFDSGVSIEGTYFDAQFEYVRAFEPASNASQRGERYRDAIKGEKLTERHVYIAQRGLPSMPPVAVFTADYWRELLTHPTDTEVLNLARQIGGDKLVQRLNTDSPEDWLELPEFMAIAARETFFKVELLTQEWQDNGWDITPAAVSPEATEQWSEGFYNIGQGIIQQKARTLAKAKAKKGGEEIAGAIEATKDHKFWLTQILGESFPGLRDATWLESFVVAGNGALHALEVFALLKMAHTAPEMWESLSQAMALHAVAKADHMATPELPCSPRAFATAKLLKDAPCLWDLASGAIPKWTNRDATINALAQWAVDNALPLRRLSRSDDRPTGFQFTPSTPAIKCAHKLLEMMGLEGHCLGRSSTDTRARLYRLKVATDIEAKLAKAKRPHDYQRRLYRLSNREVAANAIESVITEQATHPAYATLKADLLARYQVSTTSVIENPITKVVDRPTHRWPLMGLEGWIDRIEAGVNAIFRTVSGATFTVYHGQLEALA